MNTDIAGLNWFAVVVSALVTFFIGGAWYTALFGKFWLAQSRYTEEQMAKMHAERPMPVYFGNLIVCYVVIALFMGALVQATGVKSFGHGATLGLFVWVIGAMIAMTAHISSPKAWGAYLVDVGYQLVYLPLMGGILAVWK
jgi:hypothetical protein